MTLRFHGRGVPAAAPQGFLRNGAANASGKILFAQCSCYSYPGPPRRTKSPPGGGSFTSARRLPEPAAASSDLGSTSTTSRVVLQTQEATLGPIFTPSDRRLDALRPPRRSTFSAAR